MELSGKNLIGNNTSAEGTIKFHAINPVNGESLYPDFVEATEKEVYQACELARVAFDKLMFISSEQRAAFLEQMGEELLLLGDVLIKRCMEETALPEARLSGERMRTVNQLRMFAALIREGSWVNARIDHADPVRTPVPKPDIRQMQRPLGPVAIFGASNFPLAFSVAGGDTASALAAGCPVVVKGHPLHPGTSELVGNAVRRAAERTGMTEGIFSLLHGISHNTGIHIVKNPHITAVGFTGSFQGGKALFDAANQRLVPIPVFAEMGSINPVFILPGAMAERAKEIAEGLSASVTLGVGQFCTSPGLVVSETGQFSAHLETAFSRAQGGVMLSEHIRQAFDNKTAGLMATEGVDLLAKGDQQSQVSGMVFTTDAGTFLKNPGLSEEVFGPSTIHVAASGKAELMQIAEGLEGHLTATIHGTREELMEYAELVHILERKAGRLIFNGFPTGVEVCHAMHHGGPFPATTAPQSTSVGTMAIYRFTKPVCFQDFPAEALPRELQDKNPLGIMRLVDGEYVS